MRILEEGKADYLKVDPDGYRAACGTINRIRWSPS